MYAVSLRLPGQTESALAAETRLSGKKRSQIIRIALEQYLHQRAQERRKARMIAAAEALANDAQAIAESVELAEGGLRDWQETQP